MERYSNMLATKLTGETDGEGAVATAGGSRAAAPAVAPVVYALTAGDEMQGDAVAPGKGDPAATNGNAGAAATSEPDGNGSSARTTPRASETDEDEYTVGADEDQEDEEDTMEEEARQAAAAGEEAWPCRYCPPCHQCFLRQPRVNPK
jgi:hypothetical protein